MGTKKARKKPSMGFAILIDWINSKNPAEISGLVLGSCVKTLRYPGQCLYTRSISSFQVIFLLFVSFFFLYQKWIYGYVIYLCCS